MNYKSSKKYKDDGYSKPIRKKTFRKKEKYKNSFLDDIEDYNPNEIKIYKKNK